MIEYVKATVIIGWIGGRCWLSQLGGEKREEKVKQALR